MLKSNREVEKIFSDGRKYFGESQLIHSARTYRCTSGHADHCEDRRNEENGIRMYRLPEVYADLYLNSVCTKIIILNLPT